MSQGRTSREQDPDTPVGWQRMQRLAWQLTCRVHGYAPALPDPEQVEPGEREREERQRTWWPASQLLALALWRAARAEGLAVDEVPLLHALWWLGGARHDQLWAEPLPTTSAASWARLRRREARLMEAARGVVTWHVLADEREGLQDTEDGSEPPPVLLGDRCRAVASGPARDQAPPRWAHAIEGAGGAVEWATSELRAGLWPPGPAARATAAALHPTLGSVPDAPPMPAEVTGSGWMWIQRVVRLGHVSATLDTVREHHRGDVELDAHPSRPLGYALATVAVALYDIAPTVAELERAWARRADGESVASWERQHIPRPVREHVLALEALIGRLYTLCWAITNHT